ncbi:MAG: VCBS repeat-containing protein [Bacteroidota bacterium]
MNNLSSDFSKELQGKPVNTDKPRLFINNGDATFSDKTHTYGLDRTMYAMGANFGDLDNDGFLDFYVGTGAPDLSTVVPNRMFKNEKGKSFIEVSSAGLFGHIQKGHGIGFADIDRDGDQDIYAVMGGAYEGDVFSNVLFENPISDNNWVVFELLGKSTNRSAIGSRIEIELDNGRKIYHTIGTGGSFGASSLQAELGLGSAKTIRKLTLFWQNGKPQQFDNLNVNTKYRILEGAGIEEVAYSLIQ